ncbi:hypothetical protein BDF14DRAFT_1789419 [Spinellus fusiger]|nr:hypothetical protein BDF14DRAFT_1789419 [Spinellus fusiger]
MHEDSTVENKRTYRYTNNQSAIETKLRKFRKLSESLKPDEVKAAELSLSGHTSSTVNSRNLRRKFDNDAVMVIGNWSAGNAKFHESVRGVGIRRIPFKREKNPTVTCHGL